MIRKLSGACYAVRLIVNISNINTIKSLYGAYFHSVSKFGGGGGLFQQWEDIHFKKENNLNYGWCRTQNLE